MKRNKIITLSLLGAMAITGIGAVVFGTSEKAAIAKTNKNVASNWIIERGAGFGATDITDGVRVGPLNGTYARMYLNQKVKMDGLSFTFNNVNGPDSSTDGFFLSKTTNGSGVASEFFSKHTFTLWHGLYSGQSRLVVGTSHDYNDPPTCYTTSSFSQTGFGVASSMVMNSIDTNEGINVKFEHISTEAWKVTLTEVYSNTLWGSNANYYEDGSGHHCVVYLKDSDVSTYLDEEGMAYLHVFCIGDSYTKNYCEVRELNDPASSYVTKAEMQAIVDEATDEKINSFIIKPEIKTDLATKKAAAVEFLKTAPDSGTEDQFAPAVAFADAWNNRYTTYGYVAAKNTIDSGLPFTSYAGTNGVTTSSKGDYQYSSGEAWGTRMYYNNGVDMTNFAVDINLGQLPLYAAAVIVANPYDAPGTYMSEDGKYFHFEFYKYEADKYIMVWGVTTSHNVSFEGFNTESYGAYTGRLLTTNSGDIAIRISTDYENGTTSLNVNNGAIEYTVLDNSLLYKTNPKAAINGRFAFATFASSGVLDRVMICKIKTQEVKDKYFTKATNEEVRLNYDAAFVGSVSQMKIDNNVLTNGYELVVAGVCLLKPSVMNFFSVGDHTVTMVGTAGNKEWVLHIAEAARKYVPTTTKGTSYVSQGNAHDITYPLNMYGMGVDELTIKADGEALANTNYAFANYNTEFVLKGTYLSTLAVGDHVIEISVAGLKGATRIHVVVK